MARILVVDDDEGVRTFVAEALASDGHAVSQAEDVPGAGRLLDGRSFDLLFTDLRMPGRDGMDLVRKARSEQPEMEIVVLTAHGSIESAVEAIKLGAFDYVQKPIGSPAELRLLATRALERRALLAIKTRSERSARKTPPLTYGDPVMKSVEEALSKVARTPATVLLLGESGTGKGVAARAIHEMSDRNLGPFLSVNCAALPEALIESELFGHEKGAFTGAVERLRGRIELADGGTLFLDEVAELKPEIQAKLLHVLEEGTFQRVGGSRTLEADVRWIAATNRDLSQMLKEGGFRDDLYHRLAVFPVELPPLRERRADILSIAGSMLTEICRDLNRAPLSLSEDARQRILFGRWPGNLRELANALERAVILCDGSEIRAEDLVIPGRGTEERPGSLEALERDAILRALESSGGNRRQAAEMLGMGLRTLYEKLKRYEIGK